MIISHGRNYIFVHIPKTGGTALSLALEDRAMKDDILIGDTPKGIQRRKRLAALTPKGRLWKHSTLCDIDGIVTPSELSEMFCFTMVRNPWDRMVSYYHWLTEQNFDHPAVKLAKALSFQEFLHNPLIAASMQANPAQRYMTPADGIPRCDLYIRLEAWQSDKALLEAHLGFEVVLPVANVSDRKRDYRSYYPSRADVDQLALICAQDIAQFGYQFDA